MTMDSGGIREPGSLPGGEPGGMKAAAEAARAARRSGAPRARAGRGNASSGASRGGSRDRYSVFVGAAKFVLPMLAVALLTVALMWSSLFGPASLGQGTLSGTIVAHDMKNFEMIAPKYVGTDENGRPFRVEAERARQQYRGADEVALVAPKGEVIADKGAKIVITAKEGLLDQKTRLLTLTGDVNVYHDDGYTFKTEAATIDLNKKTAWGSKPVVSRGPAGNLLSEGFRIVEGGDSVIFTGRTRVLLNMSPEDMKGLTGKPAEGRNEGSEPKP